MTTPTKEIKNIAERIRKLAYSKVIATYATRLTGQSRFGRLFSSLAILFGTYLVFTLLAFNLGTEAWPKMLLNPRRIVAALLVLICIEIVDFLRENYVARTALVLLSSADGRKSIEAYDTWFTSLFSPLRQWTILTIELAIASPLIWSFARSASTSDRIQTIVTGYTIAFFGLHGLYFALLIPHLARVVSRHKMQLYWLRPADTPWIKQLSKMFTAMCIGQILGGSVAFPVLWLRMPQGSTIAFRASQFWLAIACAVVIYSFVVPQFFLARVIREKKQQDVALLQAELLGHVQTSAPLSHVYAWGSSMQNLLGAYELAAAAEETAVSFKAAIAVVGSLFLPAIAVVLQFVSVLSQKK